MKSRAQPESEGFGRSPHGERGLKCLVFWLLTTWIWSLPPRGAWIEISLAFVSYLLPDSRSPHGERGLKWDWDVPAGRSGLSLPPRGAWIEMSYEISNQMCRQSRSPHGERGLKFLVKMPQLPGVEVAPPTGSVD